MHEWGPQCRGVARGGSRCPETPPGSIIFSIIVYVDYDGRGSPNWLGPLVY